MLRLAALSSVRKAAEFAMFLHEVEEIDLSPTQWNAKSKGFLLNMPNLHNIQEWIHGAQQQQNNLRYTLNCSPISSFLPNVTNTISPM